MTKVHPPRDSAVLRSRVRAAFMISLIASSTSAQGAYAHWVTLGFGGGLGLSTRVDIDQIDGPEPHLRAMRIQGAERPRNLISEADSRTCPALVDAMKSMRAFEGDLRNFKVIVPETPIRAGSLNGEGAPPTLDGDSYWVTIAGRFSTDRELRPSEVTTLTVFGENSSVIQKWVTTTLGKLKDCWSAPVMRDRPPGVLR